MIESLINDIEQAMLGVLNNEQMSQLRKVLDYAFRDINVSSKNNEECSGNSELIDSFLSAKRVEGCSDKSIHYYRSTLNNAIRKIEKNIRHITTDDLRNYLNDYQQTSGATKVTVDNIRRILSSFFSWLEDEDYIVKSPVRRIHKVKVGKTVKETYSDEALEQMRDHCEGIRDLALIDLLASTGMRVGELVKLNRNDIDFENRECIVTGKGDKQRRVYFDARTKIHLQRYLAERIDDNPALFVSLLAPYDRLQISGVEIRLRRLGRELNIPKVHPHKFRRTLATMAIDKGMPIEQVQHLLGHQSLDTTLQYAMVNQTNVKCLTANLLVSMSQFIEMFGNPVTNTKGWKTAKIKDVAPEMPSKEQLSGKIWLLNLDMIESNTGRIIEKVYEDVENALSVQSFDEGNVLFSKLRPYLNKVVIPDEPGMATTELVPLRPEPSKLHKVFLSHLLRGNQFVNYANDIAGGTKMPRMPLTELRNFDCILPPMDKQLEFVFIAEQVDKSKFGDFKSQFIEMFGGLCQGTPWSDVVTITNGKAYPEEYQEEGAYPICGSGGIMCYGEKKLCNGNTTILGRKGNINNPIFMESGYWIVDTAFSIDVDKAKLHPKFFYYWCCQYDFTKLNKQGVLPSLTRKDLEKVKMAIPQMRDQLKFVSIAEQADKSKSVIQKALVYLNDIQSDELGKIA